jgi:hypothetical protein
MSINANSCRRPPARPVGCTPMMSHPTNHESLKDGDLDVDMSGGEEDLSGGLRLHKGFFFHVSLSKTSN